jgi:hypothetical protein
MLEWLKGTGPVKEAIVAHEFHKVEGEHLHAFVRYAAKVEWDERRWDYGGSHGNYQKAKSWRAVERYITKEGDYVSFGVDPLAAKKKKAARNASLMTEDAKSLVDRGEVDAMQLTALLKNQAAYAMLGKAVDKAGCRGVWIWGPPRTGKSHAARSNYGPVFIKAQNKWWDGYRGEATVVLDDFDSEALGHYLKIWMDRWACTGEVKGSTIPLNHDLFIVTSNYSPEDIWCKDEKDRVMAEAVRARCTMIHMTVPFASLLPSQH